MSDQIVRVEDDELALEFDQLGHLTGLINQGELDNYVKDAASLGPHLMMHVGNRDGSDQVLGVAGKPTVRRTDSGDVVLRSEVIEADGGPIPIATEARIRLCGDGTSVWAVDVHNNTDSVTVHKVAFPNLNGIRLGDRWEDDQLYFPFEGGVRFPSAVGDFESIAEMRDAPSLASTINVRKTPDGRYAYELPYAAGASMTWLYFAEPRHGLYLASHDPDFLVTDLVAATHGPSRGSMDFALRKWVGIEPGGTWSSADYVVGALRGSWHDAADRYRGWFRQQMPMQLRGGALREVLEGYVSWLKVADGRVGARFDDIPQLHEAATGAGLTLISPYGWSTGGFDSLNPEFYPDLELGGPMKMARAHKTVRERGGHVMSYLNARIFSRRSPSFDSLGRACAVRTAEGVEVTETYEPGSSEPFAVMCPGAPAWRDLLVDFSEMLVSQYHASVVYFDQIGSMAPLPCHSTDHDHHHPGEWNRSYLQLLEQAHLRATAVSPSAALSIEGCADLYAQYATFGISGTLALSGSKYSFPELFKYTFPEMIQGDVIYFTAQKADVLYPLNWSAPRDVVRRWLCKGIMIGSQLMAVDQSLDDRDWWREAEALLALHRAGAPWFAGGTFRDDRDVLHADDGLEVKGFRLRVGDHDSHLFSIFNEAMSTGLRAELRVPSSDDRVVYRLNPDGSRTSFESRHVGTDRLTISAPTDLLSMIVIDCRGEPSD